MCRSIISIFIFFMTSMALGGIVHVPQDQPSIQAGINATVNGDTVLVADSTYYENINFMGKAITVASFYIIDGDTTHRDSTIIDGSLASNPDSGSVVYFISGEDTASVICGFTITGGTGTFLPPGSPPAPPYPIRCGGGIFLFTSGAYIKNNKIRDNECAIDITDGQAIGGGICTNPPGSNSFVIIDSNKIINNLVWSKGIATNWADAWAQGGGITLLVNGIVRNNKIFANQSKSDYGYGLGGGIRLWTSTVDISKNFIDHNSSLSISSLLCAAGGISCSAANAVIDSNRITNNSLSGSDNCYGAAIYFDLDNDVNWAIVKNNYIANNYHVNGICYGGAIGMYRSSPEIYNNVIINNSADYGGALHVFNNSKPEIINNTISNNTAFQAGGALYAENVTTHVRIMNSIFWNNTASGTGHEIDLNAGSTVSAVYSDILGSWPGEGNINWDPQIVGDSLSNNSRCIGAGTDVYDFGGGIICYCPSEDINERMRPYPAGSNPDMGAWESKLGAPVGIQSMPVVGVPKSYSLEQNYPNPFNPSTTIEFDLSKIGEVTLKIFNILGEEVATLVSDRLSAGNYKYNWDATDFASGVYLYRLQAGDHSTSSGEGFVQTRKLILLK